MSIAKILTMLDGENHDAIDLEAARHLTASFGCHVDLLHVRRDPSYSRTHFGEGVPDEIYNKMQNHFKEREAEIADQCRQVFDDWRRANGIAEAERPTGDAAPSARFLDRTGNVNHIVSRFGRLADLVILKSPSLESGWLSPAGEAAIYSTGRPVLFSPSKHLHSLGERISLFWNDTVEATRASTVALPFLARAAEVEIATIHDDHLDWENVEAFAEYLGWHGVDASIRIIEPRHQSTGEALIDAAWEFKADLIVMGAFGHSRIRELVLGGVTRHVLKVAGRPVMMMH